ncbi:MAG: pitrilysin family protein [Candidatus Nanoarchaeia archaeon]|nr:pitrilysin family protein [Candidatus Nanoarchaeia archaeon]
MKPQFYRKVLNNGMTVIFEKRELPVVSVAFAVRMGALNETEEEKGLSHFIEHMLYKGTPTRNAKKIAEEIEKNGGELNGFTSENITAYWCKMPSRHLNVALNVLSDIMKNSLFDEKELEKERKVIFEEIKMYRDNPRLHVFDEIKEIMYEKPFGMKISGTFETMAGIDRKRLIRKFKEIYRAGKMVLAVVGQADFSELCEFCEKYFPKADGSIPIPAIKLRRGQKIEKRKGIDQANLIFSYHSPLAGDKLTYAAEVLIALMAGGMSSRLFSEIREKRNLAYAVKGSLDSAKDYSYSQIYVGTNKENVEKVKELILKEFSNVAETLDNKEFESIKEQLIGQYQISMEDSQTQMVNLLMDEMDGNAKKFYEYEEKIKGVKLEDVKKLAGKVAKGDYCFFALVPE